MEATRRQTGAAGENSAAAPQEHPGTAPRAHCTATFGPTYPPTHDEARARWSLDAAAVVLGVASLRGDEALHGAVRAYLRALVSWMDVAALWGAASVSFKGEGLEAQRAAWERSWHLFHDTTLDAGTDPGAQAHELVGGAVFVATGFTPRDLVDIVATMEHPHDRAGHLAAVRYLAAVVAPRRN